MDDLKTVAEVFKALGENPGVAELTGAKASTLSMWRAAGSFPSNTYVVLTDALRAVGKSAPDSLWKMRTAAEPERVG